MLVLASVFWKTLLQRKKQVVLALIIGVILNFKMHAVSAVIKGRAFAGGLSGGMAEHWTHTIIVTVLVVTAPYYWPFLAPLLPTWMSF